MMKDLYLKSGYLNIKKVLSYGMPYNLCIGGRGTGKTYGALEHTVQERIRFLFLRRMQTQIDAACNPDTSVFKRLNMDHHWSVQPDKIEKNFYGFFDRDDDNALIGYGGAISTFAGLRGIDLADVDLAIWDEFNPELSERTIKHEADALFNLLETVGRNRELDGKPPLRLLALANSNRLASPLLIRLQLVTHIERMKYNHEPFYIDRARGLAVFMLDDSPISKQKAETALYKLTAGTGFADMAVNNDFVFEDRSNIIPQPLAEYKPLCKVGELTIYKHKSADRYYVTPHTSGNPPTYTATPLELERWYKKYPRIYAKYLQRKIYFETYYCEILLQEYLK